VTDWKIRRHWLGVYHTFQDGCLPGDHIDDTPAEAVENTGCDPSANRDTCPSDAGVDPIHNYMDNSDDVCRYTWSQGQIETMHANYEYYRQQRRPDIRPVLLVDGVWSDKYTMPAGIDRQFYIYVPNNSKVRCDTRAVGGDVDLFLNWDGSYTKFDCSSQSLGGIESCEIGPKTGRAYAIVRTIQTTTDYEVQCVLTGA